MIQRWSIAAFVAFSGGLFYSPPSIADAISLPDFSVSYQLGQLCPVGECNKRIEETLSGQTILSNAVNGSIGWSLQSSQFGIVEDVLNIDQPYVYSHHDGNAWSSSGQIELKYFFEVFGPSEYILVDVSGKLEASVSGNSTSAGASLYIFEHNALSGAISTVQLSELSANYGQRLSRQIDWALNLKTNTVYEVDLFARAGSAPGIGVSTAYADPVFSIDQLATDREKYSITFSNGIGSGVTSVPEPTSVALLGIGLLAVGVVRRPWKK